MFILIPWKVDVPEDRWPVMNWLIMAAMVAVFSIQVRDLGEYGATGDTRTGDTQTQRQQADPSVDTSHDRPASEGNTVPGITGRLMLQGWHLTGLLGHMWLHCGLFHLIGNMWFLWIFGNAVCAKLGNVKYFLFYVLLGVSAGVSHLLCDGDPAAGASGAINGIVGMYLVLFYENDITCLFALWFLLPVYVRWFAVSSVWIILLWLFWDIVGALGGGSGVAYFAHLGGFAAGFAITWLMCRTGWITMERYEKSLVQTWEQRWSSAHRSPFHADRARLGLPDPEQGQQARTPNSAAVHELAPISSGGPRPEHIRPNPPSDTLIRTACACGRDIKVSRQYAGRTVRCPACREYVVIPHRTDHFGPAPAQPAFLTRTPLQTDGRLI